MKRTKPMRRRSPRRIAKETAAEKYWKQWVHTRPCAGVRSFTGHLCTGRLQQAHFRNHTGLGLKASNLESILLCEPLHFAYDSTAGEFAPMGLVGKKTWFQCRLIELRADFELEHGCPPEEWGTP